jgi:hypothetical protein
MGNSADETVTLQLEDHAVNARWRDREEALHVGLGRRQNRAERVGEQRVAVVNQVALALEKAATGSRSTPRGAASRSR